MTETGLTIGRTRPTLRRLMAMLVVMGPTACVNVSAPTRPIEINLNISVTQEVVLRLNEDAKSVIQQNPGIF